MDSVSQFVLGAAIGEVIAGKRLGNKALLWGGIAGTIPDLDVCLTPFLNEVQHLTVHRGISHALIFAFMVAPVLGWLLHRWYKHEEATQGDWTKIMFWGIFTHPLLDTCTTYGTQLFLPFSDYRAGLNSVFIIDLFYTVPLLVAVLVCCFLPRLKPVRRRWAWVALGISTAYLAMGLLNKQYIDTRFERNLAQQNIRYSRYLTGVTPLNIWLWYGIAETDSGYYMSYHSVFDRSDHTPLLYVPRQDSLIADIKSEYVVDRLIWFSKGYYAVRNEGGKLHFYDLHFGMNDLEPDSISVPFHFELHRDPNNGKIHLTEQQPTLDKPIGQMFDELMQRIKGI